jgi:hypothetical protein
MAIRDSEWKEYNTPSSVVVVTSSPVVTQSSTVVNTPSSVVVQSSTVVNTPSSVVTQSSMILADTDSDGVVDQKETQGPNNGDANNDSIPDMNQSNVATTLNPNTNKFVTVAADPTSPCQALNDVITVLESQLSAQDIQNDYPVGLVDFTSACSTSLKVKTYWYGLDTTKTYIPKKYKANGQSYDIVSGLTSVVDTINGSPVLTYSYEIFDNGVLDEDPTVGRIKDPIGPSIAVQNSGGGVITINATNNTASSSVSSISSVSNTSVTSPIKVVTESDIETKKEQKEEPQIETTVQSGINSVRTGGFQVFGLILLLVLIASPLVLAIRKSKDNNKCKIN